MKPKYKHTTARQWGGDDGYCWAVFIKGQSMPIVCGLTRREVPYYRDRIEKEQEQKRGQDNQSNPAPQEADGT